MGKKNIIKNATETVKAFTNYTKWAVKVGLKEGTDLVEIEAQHASDNLKTKYYEMRARDLVSKIESVIKPEELSSDPQ